MRHFANTDHGTVLNAYQRYQREFVEALNLCPWAKSTRERGQLALQVVASTSTQAAQSICDLLEQWSANSQVVVGLALCVDFPDDRRAFERFVNQILEANQARDRLQSPVFALAAFHPQASPPASENAKAEAWVPYVRRSPIPTIQAIRMSALERVRGPEVGGTEFLDLSQPNLEENLKRFTEDAKPLRQRIAEANLATLNRVGLTECEAILNRARAELHEHHSVGAPTDTPSQSAPAKGSEPRSQ